MGLVLLKLFINEFAVSRQQLQDKLFNATYPIILHLIKLKLMPYNQSCNHWKQEIATFLNRIEYLKGGKKYPSSKQLFDWSYKTEQDSVQTISWMKGLVNDLEEEYNCDFGFKNTFDIEQFSIIIDTLCTSYFTWLCVELSKNGYVSRSDIYNKLNNLL